MHYKDHPITEVRKVSYDMLWHVCYIVASFPNAKMNETYDRVTKEEAMKIIDKMEKRDPSLIYAV